MPTIQRRPAVSSQFSDAVHPLLKPLLAARGASSDQDIDYRLANLHKPDTLKGLDKAVDLLATALEQQQRVLLVGDFDADGATSCALAITALQAMGLQWVDFLVPNRFEYGYGLTPEIVRVARDKSPDLLVTVDNGIASIAGVAEAKKYGINVLVTDHHLPGDSLPDADAIVNPNQPGCEFPSKNLAGVGVIFYVLSALRARLREQRWFEQHNITEPTMADYLDLVALGTVADVVPLDRNNRILVHQGLQRLRVGKATPGIIALLEVAGKDFRQATSTDFGFIVGPRLNAAGRLDDISCGIQCLLTQDAQVARDIAVELDGLNRDRRAIEAAMQQEALAALDQIQLDQEKLPAGISLYHPQWHQGVVGILASRIKEKFHRPVIAFAPSGNNDGQLKGSARSITHLHIRDTLDNIATGHPDVLQKFGGHAMAAGLSIEETQLATFTKLFEQAVQAQLSEDELTEVILSDGDIPPQQLTLSLAEAIEQAGPWGQQFPEPVFDGDFYVVQQRIVGEKHLKMVLAFDAKGHHTIDAIAFNIDTQQWPDQSAQKLHLVYQLTVNRFRGNASPQLLIRHLDKH